MGASVTPSEVLAHAPLLPSYFGVADGVVVVDGVETPAVDVPGNVVYATVEAAAVTFNSVVTGGDPLRVKLALIYYTLARLYGVLADQKGMFVGLITQRGGQVSTPLGSHAELMRAATRNYQEARNLFPDADWPPLDPEATGGMIRPQRSYGP